MDTHAPGDARTALLEAAWRFAEERGLAQVTLAQIAAAAGLSRQTVYLIFGSRAGLLIGMVRHRDATSVKARKMVPAARAQPGRETIERFVRLWFAHADAILPVARAIAAASSDDEDARSAWRDRMDTQRELIRQIVDGLADSRQLSAGWTRDEATDWFWSRVHLDVWHQLVVERGWRAERAIACIVESLWTDLVGADAAAGVSAARGTVRKRSQA